MSKQGNLSIRIPRPMKPRGYTLKEIIRVLRIPIATFNSQEKIGPEGASSVLLWNWQDRTYKKKDWIGKFPKNRFIVNGKLNNISKKYVMQQFSKAFGYGLEIDPLKYHGKFITKSNLNAKHDGKIWSGPISRRQRNTLLRRGQIFQRYINTRDPSDSSMRIHYRVPVFRASGNSGDIGDSGDIGVIIPVVYEAYVKKKHHFASINHRTYLKDASKIFTPDELNKIGLFSKIMRINYAELDILRDVESQRIYIVDVNDTPTVTHRGYTKTEFRQGIALQAQAFLKCFGPELYRNNRI